MRFYYCFTDNEEAQTAWAAQPRSQSYLRADPGFESRQSDSSIHTLNHYTASLQFTVDPWTIKELGGLTSSLSKIHVWLQPALQVLIFPTIEVLTLEQHGFELCWSTELLSTVKNVHVSGLTQFKSMLFKGQLDIVPWKLHPFPWHKWLLVCCLPHSRPPTHQAWQYSSLPSEELNLQSAQVPKMQHVQTELLFLQLLPCVPLQTEILTPTTASPSTPIFQICHQALLILTSTSLVYAFPSFPPPNPSPGTRPSHQKTTLSLNSNMISLVPCPKHSRACFSYSTGRSPLSGLSATPTLG